MLPFVVFANITNNVTTGLNDNFENYDASNTIIGVKGWYGDTNEIIARTITATNIAYVQPRPMSGSNPTDILSLEAGANVLTNLFDGTDNGITNVYIDMMVQMNPADEMPAVASNTQMHVALWLNASSNLVVRHEWFDGIYNNFTTNSVFNQLAITNGQWIRLTIAMDYHTFNTANATPLIFFKVMVDGTEMTNGAAFTEPLELIDPASPGGSDPKWFTAMNSLSWANMYFSSLCLSGAGMFDEITIATLDPFSGPVTQYTITVLNLAGGWLSPTNAQVKNEFALGDPLTIFASNGYYIAYINKGGEHITPAPNYTIPSVTGNIQISASFLTSSTTLSNGVPQEWMQKVYNIYVDNYTNAAAADPDNDGYTTAEEFLWSTDPTDSNAVPRISKITLVGGVPQIQWVTDYSNQWVLPDFSIERTTDITNQASWSWLMDVPRTVGVHTNSTPAASGTGSRYFYRVVATNMP